MNLLKKIMSGSKRRSYLGIGVSNFNFNTSSAGRLGNLDTVCHNNQKNQEFLGSEEISSKDLWKMQRRAKLMLSMRSIEEYPELVEQLDRRKDWNRENRKIENLLDLFPSLKYSYSSQLPKSYSKGVVDICRSEETGNTYVGDIARSHSIRLDPVDSPKELKKYRLRIQRVIDWSYKNDLVPVMMTLTMFHRWDNLAPLCRALRLAWSGLFGSGQAGYDRKCYIGLQGFIRRMEETLNDGSEFKLGGGVIDEVACNFDNVGIEGKVCGLGNVAADESAQRSVARARNDLSKNPHSDAICLTNAGWHPHYHVILFIPRDKIQTLSEYEETLREVWVELVRKYYQQEVGKAIPASYYAAFKEHGLVLSRYKSVEHAKRLGNKHGKAGDLLEVKDGKYLSKMLGYDTPEVFGGDSEMTAFDAKGCKNNDGAKIHTGGKIPFDLLCEKLTASNVDLWCEYAIATKGIPCFTFSRGLEKAVDTYYKEHPESEYLQVSYSTNPPKSVSVGSMVSDDYKKFYRYFQIGNMLEMAKYGIEKLSEWAKTNFGIEIFKPNESSVTLSLNCEREVLAEQAISSADSIADEVKKDYFSVLNESTPEEKIQVNEEDLAVAEKMEKDVYTTYHVHLLPLVSEGMKLEEAINSLALTDFQKEMLIEFANHHRLNIRKNKKRVLEIQAGKSVSASPPPDITDSFRYELWAERELKKQESYRAIAADKNLSNEEKEKLFRLLDEYYSGSSP